MFPTSVHRLLRKIASFKDRNNPYLTPQMKARIQILQMELGFLKTFLWCSQHESLRKSDIGAAIRNGKRKLNLDGYLCCCNSRFYRAVCAFLQEIELCKRKIRQDCFHLLDFSNWCKFSSTSELLRFLNSVIHNLRNLVRFKVKAIVSVRLQVKVLIKKLRLFRDFVDFTGKKLFVSLDIHVWACEIAVMTVLLGVEQLEESQIAQLKERLINLVAKSYSTVFIGLYLRALKVSHSLKFNSLETGKIIESFIYFFLPMEYVSIIEAELMFLIACVMDQPWEKMDAEEEEEWNFMLAKAEQVAASEIPSLIRSLTVTETNKNIINDVVVDDFRQKTDKVMAGFRKSYAEILESTSHLFSVGNILKTMDSPLEAFGNLTETLRIRNDIPFAKDQFLTLHEEMVSIIPFLEKIQESEKEAAMDLWIRISEVAYQTEYLIDSIQRKNIPTWYSVMFLSDVIKDVKLIKMEIELINQEEQRHTPSRTRKRILNVDIADMSFGDSRLDLSHTDDAIFGFHDETEKIIDRLTKGQKKLDIFSIVGMPGQGKTTLAKKVYNSPLVQNHFNKFAWCFVTQIYQVKKLLMDLLRDINSMYVDEMLTTSQGDLAEKLYKCLKGQKYLIILDDIWDITAWNALKVSFPDDNNGSRILFTSRNKFWSESFLLHPLSEKESMELLNHQLVLKGSGNSLQASNLYGDAQKILEICNGLPLAIVVVASLLKRVSNNLNGWRELMQNLCSSLPSKGCMDILELSYNSLPDVLKPCFLYLAAVVKQTKVFKVQKVFQLWIAEGFVQKSRIKSLEAMAIEYLEDLVGRNLVIVHKRSFTNGVIKECLIHDLFYELCLRKVEEEKIMYLPKFSPYSSKIISYGANYLRYYNGRMTDSQQENAPKTAAVCSTVHSLLFFPGFPFPKDIFFIISMLKFVRVLDMWSVNLDHGFPEEIVDLICLRFLAISFHKPFIPLSICKLRNLESFHVFCFKTINFPITIWEMKELRNINFVFDGIYMVLNSTDTKLENLDTLSKLCLYNGEDAENLLRGFPSVRKLRLIFGIGWTCRWDCQNFQVLKTLNKLESLKLKHSFDPGQTCALNFPATLKILSISSFCHPLNKLSHIGKLPNLEILKIWHHDSIVHENQSWEVGDDEFVNLKVLKLGDFKISEWEVPTSSFQCLDRLVLKDIACLDELPSSFEEVMTLKVIQLQGCRKSLGVSAMSILSAQRDIGNQELKILISAELDEYRPWSLITFLMDPIPLESQLYERVEAFVNEIPSLICSVTPGEVNDCTVKARYVTDFQERISELMAEVRMLYIHNPNSSRPHFPITNALAFFDSLLEKFGNQIDVLISDGNYIPFAKDQFLNVHEELVSLGPFLKKVEVLQIELEEMKDLQMRITDVAYHVEYVIDSCQMTMFPIWYTVIRFSCLVEEMKFIKMKIGEIMHKQIHKIEVINTRVGSYSSHIYQGQTSGPDEVVGFKDEAEKIIDLLIRGSKRLDIVSIVGMPGLGKTTLAKKVYSSPFVHHHFDKRSWCFVTQVYSVEKLLMDILKDIGAETHNLKCLNLAENVWRCLKGHRYLIILDDIWDITAWNAIKESFPDDNKGSRVLFTSRNDFGCNPYLLRPLSDEESVVLLKYKLFYKNDWPSNISQVVEKILKICNGLPLALVVVSGLLSGVSSNLNEWGKIIGNINSNMPSEGCMDILELSYKNLPDFLKPCFLYLAAEVKRNRVFKVKKLIQIWISEGFVQRSVDKSMEDVANEYFEDLVRRSLVIVNKRSFTRGDIKECRIHDLVLELCLRKANEERFMLFPEFHLYSSEVMYNNPYRLCIPDGEMAGVWLKNNGSIVHLTPLMMSRGPIVRSLLLPSRLPAYQHQLNSDFYWRLMFVRVLDLGNVVFDCFPDEVISLIHLRYLAIWSVPRVIPSSISKLYNLENLHMKSTISGHEFPDTIWKMKTLRNISNSGAATILLNDHDANGCPKLDNLDSFSALRLSDEEVAEKILSRFPNVRKLKLVVSESWKCTCGLFQVLHLLSKLETLNLNYSFQAQPCPFNFPTALKKLTLSRFSHQWSKISAIGKLPNLEVLKLLNSRQVEGRWYVGDDEFLKVKYLKLSKLKITGLEASNSSFPCLEQLVVKDCPYLVELPSVFEYVSTLKMIEIQWCRKSVETSANNISDVQQDMGNEDLSILISDTLRRDEFPRQMTWWFLDEFPRHVTWSLMDLPRFSDFRFYVSELENAIKLLVKKVPFELGLEKKAFKRRHDRRIKILTKHNYQPRQAIISRHLKEEMKGDR